MAAAAAASSAGRRAKQLVNAPGDAVVEALEGFLLANPHLARLDGLPDVKVVLRRDWERDRVAIISGGGSGHEPLHAGYCGEVQLRARPSWSWL